MGKLAAYNLPGAWGLLSVSPFCLKLDAFLRMTGIEHEGRKIGDSTFIILYLKEQFSRLRHLSSSRSC